MSDDILTRDRQNREADSSEQYAINAMGDRALQSAGYVVKRSRRALEKAMDKSHTPPQPGVSEAGISKRAYQPVTAPQNIEPKKVHKAGSMRRAVPNGVKITAGSLCPLPKLNVTALPFLPGSRTAVPS